MQKDIWGITKIKIEDTHGQTRVTSDMPKGQETLSLPWEREKL